MSCPQGLTLSGKMCTVAPVLSCPPGHTLVNGMCQQDDGLQGFGESMNIPPSDNMMLRPGEIGGETAQKPQEMMPSPVGMDSEKGPGRLLSDVGNMLYQTISAAQPPPPPSMPGMVPSSPTVRPVTTAPQIQPIESPVMPVLPISPPPRVSVSPISVPPPPPMQNSPRPPVAPRGSPTPACPMGYSLNRMDGMCYYSLNN